MGVIHQFAPARAARLASLLLNRHSPQEIADAIEILVDVLDMMGGDPDLEDVDPDLEDDDPREDDDPSGVWASEDEPEGFAVLHKGMGPGCPVSDPDLDNDYSTIPGGGSDAA